jgi:hypothetical protein
MTLLALRSKSKALYFQGLESSAKKPRRYSHSPRITVSCWRARSGCRSGTGADRVSAVGAQAQRKIAHSAEHLDLFWYGHCPHSSEPALRQRGHGRVALSTA